MEQESAGNWAEFEFGGARLGDKRRAERLVKIITRKAMQPQGAMTTNCEKSEAQLITRLFSREEVTLESVLAPHVERTVHRCKEEKVVLAIQDTTGIDLSSHKAMEGLGYLTSKNGEQGLWLHTVLAASVNRTPLGVLHQKLWSRDPKNFGIKKERKNRAFQEKESYRWAEGVKVSENLLEDVEKVIVVGDRESDIFEMFAGARKNNVELLIRAAQNRIVEVYDDKTAAFSRTKLFWAVENGVALGAYKLKVPARNGRPKREARIGVRARSIQVMPPQANKYLKDAKPLTMYCIWAYEMDAPEDGKERIDWKLLTSITAENFKDAEFCIKSYSVRWLIEEYHKVLKSGCKIEKLQFETQDRLYPAIGVCSAVAYRVLFLSKYARENPDEDASLVGEEAERTVLSAWLSKKDKKKGAKIKTVKDFVIAVARLGGFPGRKSDGNPGTKTLWEGLRNLEYLVQGYQLALQMQAASEIT